MNLAPTPRFLRQAFLAALALRLAVLALAWSLGGTLESPDSSDYRSLAENLARHGSFARDALGVVPDLKRTPGYPLLLLPFAWLGLPLVAVTVIQCVLSAAIAPMVCLIGHALGFSSRVNNNAALLSALDPLGVCYAAQLLSDSVFSFWLAVWALGLARLLGVAPAPAPSVDQRRCFWIHGALAIATLTRPLGMLLLLPSLALTARAARRRSISLGAALSLALLGASPIAAWSARNLALSGQAGLSTIVATNLCDYRAAGAVARAEGRPFLEVRAQLRSELGDDDPTRPPREAARIARLKTQAALRLLRAHPGLALVDSARGFAVLTLSPGAGPLLKLCGLHPGGSGFYAALARADLPALAKVLRRLLKEGPAVIALMVPTALFTALLWLGLFQAARSRHELRRALWMLGAAALILLLAASGPESEPRFRAPAMCFLCLLAAKGLTDTAREREKRPRPEP